MKFFQKGRHRSSSRPLTRRERRDVKMAHRVAERMPAMDWTKGYTIVSKQLWHTRGGHLTRPFTPAEVMSHFNAITSEPK